MRAIMLSVLALTLLGCVQPSAEASAGLSHNDRVDICNRQHPDKEDNPAYDRCVQNAYRDDLAGH